MASGIKIDDDVKLKVQQVTMNYSAPNKAQKLRYAVFEFSKDLTKVIVEKCGTDEDVADYDSLISSLPTNDVRYLCYDFEYINKDNCKKSDIILISWHPDGSSVRKKMICASTFNALKQVLNISGRNVFEADNFNEVDSKAVLEKIGGKPCK